MITQSSEWLIDQEMATAIAWPKLIPLDIVAKTRPEAIWSPLYRL
jgi:hypothetical protein